MSKVNEPSDPEPALSPNASPGTPVQERYATADDSETVPRQVKALPLRAKEPQTFGQRSAGGIRDAKLYSNFARMYYYWSERLRDLYREKKYIECRQGCLDFSTPLYAKRCLKEAQRRLDHLDSRKKSVQILLSENQILLETVKAHMTAEDTEEDAEEDELVPRMGVNILLDDPPYFDWQASADAPAEATGVESDDTIGFFAGRDAQERWESMIFREEVKDFYLVIEEEDDNDPVEEEDDDDSVEEEDDDDDSNEEEDYDDPIEEEREYDPIEEALAEKREKAE
ncbi:hypothetical protein KC315_g9292 [Hortaea werneckii]|nr:hypothetical protein KC315_g9292 [Hortaea werneckii]